MSKRRWMLCATTIVLASFPPGQAGAQAGGPYDLSWNTIDSGGGPAAGGALDVFGSIGEPSISSSSGGAYTIDGGFVQEGLAPAGISNALIPSAFSLEPARPNPASADVAIPFAVADETHIRLRIFTADGALVRELIDQAVPAGRYTAYWDAKDRNNRHAAGGIYFVRLESADQTITRKLAVAR